MAKEVVGKVSIKENDEIQRLFKRKEALIELCGVLRPEDTDLYEKLINDLGNTIEEFNLWWKRTSIKYEWKSFPDSKWSIDFDNREVSLITK